MSDHTTERGSEPDRATDQESGPAGEHGAETDGAYPDADGGDDHAREEPTGWRYWLYTTNHKTIGIIYMWLGLFFFALAGLLALIFRADLAMNPDSAFLSKNGYNALIGIHGLTMIIWVIPAITGAFQNYFIPLLTGTDEMAFPRWNALGAWSIFFGGILLYLPFLTNLLGLTGLPMNAGWFQYPPLNTMHATAGTDAELLASVTLIGFGSTAGGINFFTTVVNERRPDLGWFDLPISIWAFGILTPILGFYAFPWVINALGLQFLDRSLDMAFFNVRIGGDPLLYQWIWWSFGHPEVYIMVIPGMGIALEIISRFSERPLFGYRPVVGGFVLLTVMSLGVWAHHMYTAGLAASRYVFMVFSMGIVVAFAIFIFSAVATMYRGRIHLTTPLLFAVGDVIGLIYSGMEGIELGQPALDIQLHSTYFVVGHFHFTLFMVGVMGLLAGIYYWYPNMTGRMYNTFAAKYHAFSTLLGLPLLFFLMSNLGELGMMRRYATYTYAPGLQFWHILTTAAAFFVASGQLAFFLNLIVSLRYGPRVENPWQDLFSGQHMPSPEWNGFPYRPPTPAYVYGDSVEYDGGILPGDGMQPDGRAGEVANDVDTVAPPDDGRDDSHSGGKPR